MGNKVFRRFLILMTAAALMGGIGAIGADADQLFHIGVGRQRLARRLHDLALVRQMTAWHGPADRLQHVDRREAAGRVP